MPSVANVDIEDLRSHFVCVSPHLSFDSTRANGSKQVRSFPPLKYSCPAAPLVPSFFFCLFCPVGLYISPTHVALLTFSDLLLLNIKLELPLRFF